LLRLAADAIGPVVGGCAGALAAGPVGIAFGAWAGEKVGAGVKVAVEKAIDYFGPPIIERWLRWLRSRPKSEQLAAVSQLGSLSAEEARHDAAAELDRVAPSASPQDRATALEYLAAIPATVLRSLVPDPSGGRSLPPTMPPDSEQTLLQLLPTDVPPYPPGTPLPATPYRLEELLGTGGFGAVYRATDPNLQHLPLAVKFCLDAKMKDTLRQERDNLERLMQAGKKGWSDRIVRLYGYNLDHATPFLVYEYVPGGDLANSLRASIQQGKHWSPATVSRVVRQVAEGLAFAHERGLVHRDLKPANVLVAGKHLKLADFGIGGVVARHAAGQSHVGSSALGQLTRAERVSLYRGAGTPLYMSPEQRRGEPADPRQDLYSLGVMWYQLLVGDVTRELHPGWDEELAEECQAPEAHIAIIRRCVGLLKKRPRDAQELLALLLSGDAKSEKTDPPSPQPAVAAAPVSTNDVPPPRAETAPLNPLEDPFRRADFLAALERLSQAYTSGQFAWAGGCIGAFVAIGLVSLGVFAFSGGSWGIGILLIALALLFYGSLLWWGPKLAEKARTQHVRMLAGLIDTFCQQYPEEVQSIGGRSVLEAYGRLQAVLGVLRQPPKREGSGVGS
jgi:serine/threonine protein kinase